MGKDLLELPPLKQSQGCPRECPVNDRQSLEDKRDCAVGLEEHRVGRAVLQRCDHITSTLSDARILESRCPKQFRTQETVSGRLNH